jgi:hypothetical protein
MFLAALTARAGNRSDDWQACGPGHRGTLAAEPRYWDAARAGPDVLAGVGDGGLADCGIGVAHLCHGKSAG